jgi:hypothetical protein
VVIEAESGSEDEGKGEGEDAGRATDHDDARQAFGFGGW